MWRPTAWLSFATVVVLLLNLRNVHGQTEPDDDPYNILKFNNLRLNDPESLCKYLQCLSPVKDCPEGTFWREKVSVYGCCGGCVRFSDADTPCTGSMDPMYGEGYCDITEDGELSCTGNSYFRGAVQPSNSSSFKSSLRVSTSGDADANIIDSSWCGYGLQCTTYGLENYCQPPIGESGTRTCTQLYNILDTFMKGHLYDEYRDDYLWLPDCTLEGLYKPKQCKGPIEEQRCVCVDPKGGSIYGAAYPFQEELYDSMNCGCSRRVWEQQNNEGIESPTLHCLENGNYEPLQCENGYCYCIDPNTTLTYGPTVPEKAMFILPCYNKTLLGGNNKYLRLCDSESHAHSTLRSFMTEKGISQAPLPSLTCDPDGSYSGMMCGSICNCVDKTGKITQNSVYEEYGCNCKRDTDLLASLGQNKAPICRGGSGGYYTLHSDQNGAYCVDDHGIRSSSKVREKYCGLLKCNSYANCQQDGQTEEDEYKTCELACEFDGEPCPQCVYVSYQGDMSECDEIDKAGADIVPDECTDVNHGNA